jgi:hypothetical protein
MFANAKIPSRSLSTNSLGSAPSTPEAEYPGTVKCHLETDKVEHVALKSSWSVTEGLDAIARKLKNMGFDPQDGTLYVVDATETKLEDSQILGAILAVRTNAKLVWKPAFDLLEIEMPSDWQALPDPSSGQNYYWNPKTNETTWTKPATATERKSQPKMRDVGTAPLSSSGSGAVGPTPRFLTSASSKVSHTNVESVKSYTVNLNKKTLDDSVKKLKPKKKDGFELQPGTLDILVKIGREASLKTTQLLVQVNIQIERPNSNRQDLDLAVSENRSSVLTVIEALKAQLSFGVAVAPQYAEVIARGHALITDRNRAPEASPTTMADCTTLNKTRLIKQMLVYAVQNESAMIRGLLMQLSDFMRWQKESKEVFVENLVELVAICQTSAKILDRLMVDAETLWAVYQLETTRGGTLAEYERKGQDYTPLWEECGPTPNGPLDSISVATLNELVTALTSPVEMDTNWMQTFIQTYRSFVDPYELLRKIRERFDVPSEVDPDQAKLIKVRTSIVLKHWVENQSIDLTTDLLEELADFVSVKFPTAGLTDIRVMP